MDGESNPIMPRPIDYIEGYQAGGFTEALADETSVHHNIDKLLFEANLPKHTMGVHKPFVIGGTDDIVANIAMSPLIAAKKIPSLLKKIKNINLTNPLYHYTSGTRAAEILEQGVIKGKSLFPGANKWDDLQSGSVAMTRDPAFMTRPHGHVPTDITFIADKSSLKRKGRKIKPFVEKGYEKTNVGWEEGWKREGQMNPRFEFEERIKGNLPLEDIKMINVSSLWGDYWQRAGLLRSLKKSKIPLMFSENARFQLKRWLKTAGQPAYAGGGFRAPHPEYVKEKTALLESLLKHPSYKNPLIRQ